MDRVFWPVAIGQVLAATETLTLRDIFRPDGYLRGMSADDQRPGTLRHRAATVLDHHQTPRVLAGVQAAAAVALLAGRGSRRTQIAASTVIGVCNRLSEIRTPYGRDGADQMTGVITQYRAVSAVVGDPARSDELFLRAVNLQAGLSYAVSGVSKALGSSWVQGDALHDVLQSEAYGNGPAAAFLKRRPRLCRALTVGTIAWECAFPLVYVLPQRHAHLMLTAVKGFHVGVAAVMELPRFVWGFTASHGAVSHVVRSHGNEGPLRDGVLERSVLGLAAAGVGASSMIAKERRTIARARRLGPKGTRRLEVGDGVVEYVVDAPATVRANTPVVLLENGLGESLESWTWVAENLSRDHVVVRYHRPGYGLTSSTQGTAEVVARLLDEVEASGPLHVVTHSIGSLFAAQYVETDVVRSRLRTLVVVDGTDPDLLEADRSDRRSLGAFLQIQGHTLFAAVTGFSAWAPSTVERQAAYAPDEQFLHVQFAFDPKNIVTGIREYRGVDTSRALRRLARAPRVAVVASSENAQPQEALARKLSARHQVVAGSSHRSMLGHRELADQVAYHVREAIGDR